MSGQIEVTPNGIKVPEASEIKTAFQTVFTNALGTDLSLDDATPQGDLINGLTEEKQLDNGQLLYILNQFNPSTADGIWQDALANIYFLQRKPATNSIVSCVCTGLAGTVLNGVASGNPALAQSTNGDIFQCLAGGTIPASGSITLEFAAVETGPIPVAANTVNKIYNVVSGWDTINNTSSGIIGVAEESRQNFAERIKSSLGLNATGSLVSVYTHIFECDGVTDVRVDENPTNNSVTKAGVTLAPHSVWICEKGATNTTQMAEAIFNSLSAGCDTNGSNTCSFVEPTTGVTFSYKYATPTQNNIYIKVSLGASIPTATQNLIKETLYKNFTGQNNDGYTKVSIGDDVYATRFYSAVLGLGLSEILLENIKVSKNGTSWADSLSYNQNILPVLDIESTSPAYVQFEVV